MRFSTFLFFCSFILLNAYTPAEIENAVSAPDISMLTQALNSGLPADYVFSDGRTLLETAIDAVATADDGTVNLEAVNLLIQSGADLKSSDKYGIPPLFRLIDCYSVWNSPLYDTVSGLISLTGLKNGEMQKVLNCVKEMVNRGADVNFQTAEYGESVLMTAVNSRDPALVKYLLARGADPFQKTTDGYDAYEMAVELAQQHNLEYQKPVYLKYVEIAQIIKKAMKK